MCVLPCNKSGTSNAPKHSRPIVLQPNWRCRPIAMQTNSITNNSLDRSSFREQLKPKQLLTCQQSNNPAPPLPWGRGSSAHTNLDHLYTQAFLTYCAMHSGSSAHTRFLSSGSSVHTHTFGRVGVSTCLPPNKHTRSRATDGVRYWGRVGWGWGLGRGGVGHTRSRASA